MLYKLKNKKIGIYKDGVFSKKVDKSKHFFRKHHGYGIDYKVIAELPRETKVIIDDGTIRETTIAKYQDEGTIRQYGNHGRQIILDIDKF